jgi:hypothetical protein
MALMKRTVFFGIQRKTSRMVFSASTYPSEEGLFYTLAASAGVLSAAEKLGCRYRRMSTP